MNNFKSFFGFAIAIGFLLLGFYLTNKEEEYQMIIGYVTLVFWSIVLIFAIFKKITNKKINN